MTVNGDPVNKIFLFSIFSQVFSDYFMTWKYGLAFIMILLVNF